MSKVCEITGKGPMSGHNVSHANNKTNRRFEVNIHTKKIWVSEVSRYIVLRVSSQGLRIIDKLGIVDALKRAGILTKYLGKKEAQNLQN